MWIQPCPECRTLTARLLDNISNDAHVNYYRCQACGHVWTLPKGEMDAVPTAITHRNDEEDNRVLRGKS